MAVYEYQAIARSSGRKVKGIIDADSPAAARRKLREQELFPTTMSESFGKGAADEEMRRGGWGRVTNRDISLMTRQLGVLIHAGMPIVEALGALLEQTSSARLRKIVYDVRGKVNEGSTLADALRSHPRIFSELYVNMVRAGEESGALEQVMIRLADLLERQVRLQQRVQKAMAYPAVMAVFGIGVISFLMTVIVPKITAMFQQQGRELPGVTKALIGISDFVGSYWWLIVLAVLGLYGIWRAWVSRPEGRLRWDTFRLRLPLFGALHVRMICGRFARTLGTMLESGLSMMVSLEVVKSVVQNRVVEEAMEDVKAGVRRGRDLATPLKDAGVFPPMLIHMVELGQRSGELEAMLLRIADTYDEDVEMTVDALVGLLEPFMIVVMGCFVGFLVIAMLLPIFQMRTGA
jgi:general secretion pathway protein F